MNGSRDLLVWTRGMLAGSTGADRGKTSIPTRHPRHRTRVRPHEITGASTGRASHARCNARARRARTARVPAEPTTTRRHAEAVACCEPGTDPQLRVDRDDGGRKGRRGEVE